MKLSFVFTNLAFVNVGGVAVVAAAIGKDALDYAAATAADAAGAADADAADAGAVESLSLPAAMMMTTQHKHTQTHSQCFTTVTTTPATIRWESAFYWVMGEYTPMNRGTSPKKPERFLCLDTDVMASSSPTRNHRTLACTTSFH